MDAGVLARAWQDVPVAPSSKEDPAADAELRALLEQLKAASGLTYDQLAAAANMSRNSVMHYITRPGHRRGTRTLEGPLTALCASEDKRTRALELHRRTRPVLTDPGALGWTARVRQAGCVWWPMGEFTAVAATVHTAIGRRHQTGPEHGRAGDAALPAYVPRAHDYKLRADVEQAAAGDLRALIVLRGTSSTGKTRSLFEAVHAICSGWTVIRPLDAGAARGLPESGLFDGPGPPVVVWLNELQGFLGLNGRGLSVHVLADLYTAAGDTPVVVVGTLWPNKLRVATDPRDETRSDARELLAEATPWVRWHEVPPNLTTDAERAAARELAKSDPRVAAAAADPDRFGFTQTLAGAHELLEHYANAPTMAGLLLDAAVDARRLGHTSALSKPLLRAATLALWRENHGHIRPPSGWFDQSLGYATRALRSYDGVRALISLDDPETAPPAEEATEPFGYGLADYLEQHLTCTRALRPVPDQLWEALASNTRRIEDLSWLAISADRRGRYGHANRLHHTAAADGNPVALRALASWLSMWSERAADAEAAYRKAVAAGDLEALDDLAGWLRAQPGRESDAEAAYRDTAAAGDPRALISLARWLSTQPGREADTEATYREAAAVGVSFALADLADWLRTQPGREADTEATYREAIQADGDSGVGLTNFARWLSTQPGREADTEATYRQGAAVGEFSALVDMASWLRTQPGREADAEATYRQAIQADGDLRPVLELMVWLYEQPGRETDAEALSRRAETQLDRKRDPRRAGDAETEATYREAIQAAPGDLRPLIELAKWLDTKPGRQVDAEAIYREAAALIELPEGPGTQPGQGTEATYREAAGASNPVALVELARRLRARPGRESDAEATYREAVAGGDLRPLIELARWLGTQPGREAEAEATYREAAAAGWISALRDLIRWLSAQPGREAEAHLVYHRGLDAYGQTIDADLK